MKSMAPKILKVALGLAIAWIIISKLTLDDELFLRGSGTEPEVIQGHIESIEGALHLVAEDGTEVGPFLWDERPPLVRRRGDMHRVRLEDGTEHTGVQLRQVGTIHFRESDTDELRQVPFEQVAWREGGQEDGWVELLPGWREGLKTIFKRLSIPRYLLGLFCILLMYLFGIKRWQLLMRAQSLDVPFTQAGRLTFIGYFFNNVVPGMTGGDVIKALMIARAHPGRGPTAISTVVVDRVLGLVVLAAMAAVVLLFNYNTYEEVAFWVFLFLFLALAAAFFFLSRRVRKLLRIDRLLKRLPGSDMLQRLDQAFLGYRTKPLVMLQAVVLSVLAHAANIMSVFVMGTDLGVAPHNGLFEPALLTYAATVPIVMIVSSIPLLPGGWGLGEAAFGYFFRTVGIHNLSLSVGLSVLHRFSLLLFSLLGGVMLICGGRGGSYAPITDEEQQELLHEAETQTAPGV